MKKIVTLVGLASVLVACGSNPPAPQAQVAPVRAMASDDFSNRVYSQQDRQDRIAERQVEQAPAWMTKLPKSENAVYATGTAVSADFSMADMKANAIAYSKICTSAGGKVRSQTKMYRADTDTSSTETSEVAIRSMCPDIDITGVETVEMKHISEGGRIRSYVLVALPIGDANSIAKGKQAIKEREMALKRAPDAFKELDSTVETPVHQSPAGPISQVAPVELKLLDVDNAEYKARRDATLQKPNSVIGQTTLQ